jgi:hypothetical protein
MCEKNGKGKEEKKEWENRKRKYLDKDNKCLQMQYPWVVNKIGHFDQASQQYSPFEESLFPPPSPHPPPSSYIKILPPLTQNQKSKTYTIICSCITITSPHSHFFFFFFFSRCVCFLKL